MLWWKLQRLKSGNAKTRCRAVQDMALSGDPSAVDPCVESLGDDAPEVRLAAARALGALKDARGFSPLVEALKDRNSDVRAAAATSLRQLGDSRAISPLTASLNDSDHTVRWQAATALNGLGWKPSTDTEHILRSAAMGQHENLAVHGNRAVDALTRALSDPSCPRRHAAARALGETNDQRALKPLLDALRDEDSHVRVAAVEALSELGNSEASASLFKCLSDREHRVRAAAVDALGRLGDARIVEPIEESLLHDASWDVRKLSVEALGRIKNDRATQLLWQALRDRDHDVRQTAAAALGPIPDPRSIAPLVLTLKDENSAVRQAAKGALRQIDRQWELSPGAQSVIPELEAAANDKEYWVAQSAADALAKIHDMRQRHQETSFFKDTAKEKTTTAISILIETLRDSDRDFRQAAAEALGRIDDVRVVTPLVSALDDQDEWVGRAAALALNHLNWTPAADDTRRAQKLKSLMLKS
jgi:HEAT repeat protein